MKKAKRKKPVVAKVDYVEIAKELYTSFLIKGFTTAQAFELTTLVLSKCIE